MSFSILILTYNEETNIRECLDSVAWCDDVVVLDSLSTDRTRDIAECAGARVVQRPFDDFGGQRNFAHDHVPFRHPWVFHLDADERFTRALRAECERVVTLDERSAYFVPNRVIFMGKWIRRSTMYPHPQVRFVKIGEMRFTKAGHGQREADAKRGVGHLQAPYDHYNCSKGIADWVEKHNTYSTAEALALRTTRTQPLGLLDLARLDGVARRRALKRLHARLPLRWLVKFVYLYVLRLGLLDGYPGFAYCVMQSFYDFLITAKSREAAVTHREVE